MSIISTIYVPEGIVMSADSRITLNKTLPNQNIVQYMSSDNAQKLFLLNKVKVGVSSCGDAMIGGATIADFIRQFEIQNVKKCHSVEKVANELSIYLQPFKANVFFLCLRLRERYALCILGFKQSCRERQCTRR